MATTSPARSDRHYRLLIGTAAFVIIAAGIREAAPVLNSILLAMLLTVTVVPASRCSSFASNRAKRPARRVGDPGPGRAAQGSAGVRGLGG